MRYNEQEIHHTNNHKQNTLDPEIHNKTTKERKTDRPNKQQQMGRKAGMRKTLEHSTHSGTLAPGWAPLWLVEFWSICEDAILKCVLQLQQNLELFKSHQEHPISPTPRKLSQSVNAVKTVCEWKNLSSQNICVDNAVIFADIATGFATESSENTWKRKWKTLYNLSLHHESVCIYTIRTYTHSDVGTQRNKKKKKGIFVNKPNANMMGTFHHL